MPAHIWIREGLIMLGRAILFLLLGAALVAVLLLTFRPVGAHEWYPSECCSSVDCYEVSDTDFESVAGGGWRVKRTKEVFQQSDTYYWNHTKHPRVRVTPPEAGGTWHRCSYNGDPASDTICVFMPPMGN